MNKIPSVFRRDPANMRRLLPEVNPGCEWVLAGEGVPTRKYDGTCVMFDGTDWWARREVKPGKQPPPDWREVTEDDATGKRMGWEPIGQSGFAKSHAEALRESDGIVSFEGWPTGTYELCGPKVNGNPERFGEHTLRLHAAAERFTVRPDQLSFEGLRFVVSRLLHATSIEGIVWHHPDGRMAKLKGKDFA